MLEYYDHTCACGCGGRIPKSKWHKYDGVPKFIRGHSSKGKSPSLETREKIGSSHKGKIHSPETREKIKEARKKQVRGPCLADVRMKIKEAYTSDLRKRLSDAMTGDKNPNWRGGSSSERYAPEFNNQLKSKIKCRDENVCQICKLSSDCARGGLCIHHVDYNKENSDPNNLILLCRSCHAQTTNSNREYWRRTLHDLLERQTQGRTCFIN